jgi:peptide chain release factor 1
MIQDLISDIEKAHADVTRELADPDVLADRERYLVAARRHSELESLHVLVVAYRQAEQAVAEAEELLAHDDTADPELREYLQDEAESGRARLAALGEEVRVSMLARDPDDVKDAILEIRAGAGGDEAALFAADLYRMYSRHAERKGLTVELLSENIPPTGGFKEVIAEIKGGSAYGVFKYESGVHRVQRVPATEAASRIHTSTATVAVLPEVEDIDIHIDPNDIRIDIFRARGPGGQSVNTTDSAVRVTHVPTGLVVSCQDEKSQLQNKERALRILRARLYELRRDEQERELAAARRGMVQSGDRAQKIRTYNYQQSRVTDHRIGFTTHRLFELLDGDLDELTESLTAADRQQQLASLSDQT